MCSYLMLEIKYFVSLKTEFFLFWTRIHFKGAVKFSKILRGDAHKGGLTFFFFWGGGVGKWGARLKGVRSVNI